MISKTPTLGLCLNIRWNHSHMQCKFEKIQNIFHFNNNNFVWCLLKLYPATGDFSATFWSEIALQDYNNNKRTSVYTMCLSLNQDTLNYEYQTIIDR